MKKLISIVIPTYNEEVNIAELCKQIEFHMNKIKYVLFIFIDYFGLNNNYKISI